MQKIDYQNYKTLSDFLKLPEGETPIRIISSGAYGFEHDKKMGNRMIPLGECPGFGCKHCKDGVPRKKVWVWIAFDHIRHETKVLKVGKRLGDQICEYAMKNNIESGSEFNILIRREGLSKEDTKYIVSAASQLEISADEMEAVTRDRKYLISRYFN